MYVNAIESRSVDRDVVLYRRYINDDSRKKNCIVCENDSGICEVVCKLSCFECSSFHVGEGDHPLVERYKQQIGEMKRIERGKPWSIHMRDSQGERVAGTKTEVSVFERNLQCRKAGEAVFIFS